jgi:hypothetical protein
MILTTTQSTKMCEPPPMAHWDSSERYCAACCHTNRPKEKERCELSARIMSLCVGKQSLSIERTGLSRKVRVSGNIKLYRRRYKSDNCFNSLEYNGNHVYHPQDQGSRILQNVWITNSNNRRFSQKT